MSALFGNSSAVATEIGGQFRPGQDKYVRSLVGPVCKVIWPEKTDHQVACICDCDPRNARRYMSGELPIPAVLLAAINNAIVKR
jgi:hypothetical protein